MAWARFKTTKSYAFLFWMSVSGAFILIIWSIEHEFHDKVEIWLVETEPNWLFCALTDRRNFDSISYKMMKMAVQLSDSSPWHCSLSACLICLPQALHNSFILGKNYNFFQLKKLHFIATMCSGEGRSCPRHDCIVSLPLNRRMTFGRYQCNTLMFRSLHLR